MEEIKQTGLNIEQEEQDSSEMDYMFGSTGLGLAVRRENGDWRDILPTGERQRKGVETMSCVAQSNCKVSQIEFTEFMHTPGLADDDFKWLEENGYFDDNGNINFSDRYLARLSGTTSRGNSLKRVADVSRKFGYVPEALWPHEEGMSWGQYYESVPATVFNLGREFAKRFPMKYEKVQRNEFSEAIKRNPLQIALHAWPEPINGIYMKTPYSINHASSLVAPQWYDFDSYIDRVDNDFVKHLSPDYIFMSYGYRFIFTLKAKVKEGLVTKVDGEVDGEFVPEGTYISKSQAFRWMKRMVGYIGLAFKRIGGIFKN